MYKKYVNMQIYKYAKNMPANKEAKQVLPAGVRELTE